MSWSLMKHLRIWFRINEVLGKFEISKIIVIGCFLWTHRVVPNPQVMFFSRKPMNGHSDIMRNIQNKLVWVYGIHLFSSVATSVRFADGLGAAISLSVATIAGVSISFLPVSASILIQVKYYLPVILQKLKWMLYTRLKTARLASTLSAATPTPPTSPTSSSSSDLLQSIHIIVSTSVTSSYHASNGLSAPQNCPKRVKELTISMLDMQTRSEQLMAVECRRCRPFRLSFKGWKMGLKRDVLPKQRFTWILQWHIVACTLFQWRNAEGKGRFGRNRIEKWERASEGRRHRSAKCGRRHGKKWWLNRRDRSWEEPITENYLIAC